MSQIILTNSSGSGPVAATEFVANDGTIAVPLLNELNIFGAQTYENVSFGIKTTANPANLLPPLPADAGNTIYVALTNRITGTTTTVNSSPQTIVTLPLDFTTSSSVPATFFIWGNVQAFNPSTPVGASYSFSGAFKTDGSTATVIAVEFHDQFEDSALDLADLLFTTSGNNFVLQVQGVVGLTINWNALVQYNAVTI